MGGISPFTWFAVHDGTLVIKIYFHKYGIPLILLNPEIFFGDLVGGVIINIHQKRGWRPLLPGVVAEGLP